MFGLPSVSVVPLVIAWLGRYVPLNPTGTPPIDYTPDLFYMMANISNFVNVNWYVSR